jgi:hypothetical protein
MKTLLRVLPLLVLVHAPFRAAEPATNPGPRGPGDPARLVLLAPGESRQIVAAARAADDERVAATKAGDRARLTTIFSDELRYGHSSGKVDTKASYIESLASHSTVYETYDYRERNFLPAAPSIVLMTGRVLVRVRSGGQERDLDLNFLAVWREENCRWRFLSWQSCQAPGPAPAAK